MGAEEIESVESTGVVALPVRKVAELLAECPSFQERLGVVSAVEALKSIAYPHAIFSANQEPRGPCAVVWLKSCAMDQGAGPWLRLRSATIAVLLHDVDRYPDKPEWSEADFSGWVGAVVDDLVDLESSGERVAIQSLAMPDGALIPPSLQAAGEAKPYWTAALELIVGATRR